MRNLLDGCFALLVGVVVVLVFVVVVDVDVVVVVVCLARLVSLSLPLLSLARSPCLSARCLQCAIMRLYCFSKIATSVVISVLMIKVIMVFINNVFCRLVAYIYNRIGESSFEFVLFCVLK